MRSKFSDIGWLFALNCLIVAAIAAVLFPVMIALDIEMSSDMSELFKRPVWQVLAIVVIVGPIMEELIFRSWLSGNPRLLVLFGGILAWVGGSYLLTQSGYSSTDPIPLVILAGAILIGSLAGLIRYWKRAVPGWFTAHFSDHILGTGAALRVYPCVQLSGRQSRGAAPVRPAANSRWLDLGLCAHPLWLVEQHIDAHGIQYDRDKRVAVHAGHWW